MQVVSYQSSFIDGVVSANSRHETIDFTNFPGTFQYPVVAYKIAEFDYSGAAPWIYRCGETACPEDWEPRVRA